MMVTSEHNCEHIDCIKGSEFLYDLALIVGQL
jgi:hypothetical protein